MAYTPFSPANTIASSLGCAQKPKVFNPVQLTSFIYHTNRGKYLLKGLET
jgi:hypothetical protein